MIFRFQQTDGNDAIIWWYGVKFRSVEGLVQVDNEKGFPDLSDLLLFYKVCVESASGL